MKIVVLTTETTHHAFFVRELAAHYSNISVFAETNSLAPPFPCAHAFEAGRDQYEQDRWFNGKSVKLSNFADTTFVLSANQPDAVSKITAAKPDVIVVFGTGRLKDEVIAVNPGAIINLHGGDPEEYRGLDTHLWAIYHRDFAALVSTLHRLNTQLDDGAILLQAQLELSPNIALHQLRRVNAEVCADMTIAALAGFQSTAKFVGRPQRKRGRYYSFMPTEIKEICANQFLKFSCAL